MKSSRFFLLAFLLTALVGKPARAHFLFIRILPLAEGGRAAEVYFSELAEAGDPRFISKIAHTELWLQTASGNFEPLKVHQTPDRLRAWLPYTGSLVVAGKCRYGVLARSGQTPFLLRHFPKAIAGNPDELNKRRPHGKLPLEIVATIEGERMRLVALRDGKPVPKAEFVTVDGELKNLTLTADGEGQAQWTPPAPGNYAVYTRHTSKEAGDVDGQKYEEIRDFATLAFAWPLERKDADSAAVALFEEALAARATWQDFPGFSAAISGNLDGRSFDGTITIDARGKVTFADTDPSREESVASWVQEQLESIVLHRMPQPAATGARPKPVLRFGESKNDHPLGRLLIFDGGKFASSYRVKDRQIMVVNRHVGQQNMTITVLDNDRNAEGLFLPRSYAVQYWDATSGALTRTETVQERWQRVHAWDLPAQHTVTTATQAGLAVQSFTLTKHEILKSK
jgi:hypothetical protein